MKRTRYQRFAKALRWGVEQGAVTVADAVGALALASFAGFGHDPDADEPSSKTVRAERVKAMKTKANPDSLRGTKAGKLFNGARVKDASERLSNVKHAVKDRTGNVLKWGASDVQTQSEKEKAVVGCWFKNEMRRAGVPGVILTEFEKALLAEHVQKGKWCGEVGGTYYGGGAAQDYVPNATVKALLDDTVSGGLLLAPVEFDSNVITFPLLHGEIFPMVELIPVSGRRIQGATVGNVTMGWGTAPGTAITPFSAAALVNELSTPIWPLSGALEISNELMADSPVNIGATFTALYGEKQRAELDRVIIAGNGTTEPQGITNASGLVAVGSDNGTGGPPTVSDYEGLIFAVPKQYRQREWAPSFVGNDTSYRRARGIAVGPGDERRVFGMDEQSYTLLDYPYKVQNDMPNTRILFGCWKKFRMYQRLGSEVTVTREGRSLALANTTLVVVRSRFGGQASDRNAFAICTDAQS